MVNTYTFLLYTLLVGCTYVSQKKKEKKKRKARCEEVGEFSDSDGEKTHIEIE